MTETICLYRLFKHPFMKYVIAGQIYGLFMLNKQVYRLMKLVFHFCKLLP